MITSKKIPIIAAMLVCVCLILCGLIVYGANTFDITKTTEYEKRMFGDEIIVLDIQVDNGDWQDLLSNAQAKEWISANITINGELFSTVGIRTKGNSSLSMGSRMGGSSDGNYSLQIKMNKYVKGQTYYGLDTFCVNNMMGDTTYMKDYLAYDIMSYIGVDTPLTNYASITVNGEDYGFGLALERYDKAFLDRVYSTSAGELYNVKIGMGQRGNFEDAWQDVENAMPNRQQGNMDFGNRGGGMGMGGGFGGNGGGSLVYTGDNISSYSAIFDNAIFNSSDADKQRVITALKNLNEGNDLEKYIDVDATLRYFAAHTVVVNLDSYTSNMQQNYYLYERDGKLTILPWDYGLSFGGFQSGNASSVVNYPIDTPVSGVSMESRPLLNMLLEVDEYRERYHDYLRQIVEGYFESGLYESTIRNLDMKINEYVKNDVSALYTYEQYEASLLHLIELGHLRAESIKGQLDGTIPSTSSEQSANSTSLIDASTVNLSALGSMMGGGGMGQGGRQDWQSGQEEIPSMPDGENEQPGGQGEWQGGQGRQPGGQAQGGFPGGGMFDASLMQQAMQILMEAGGELTEEVKEALLELGLTEDQIEMFLNMQGGFPGRGGQGAIPDGDSGNGAQANPPDGFDPQQGNMPGRSGTGSPTGSATQSATNTGYIVFIVILLVLLVGAIVFVARPRKNVV